MNNFFIKHIGIIVAGLLILAIIGVFTPWVPRAKGGTGSLAIEDYNPTIMYNGGFFSRLPIQTDSNLTIGGTSEFTGTTTIALSPDGFVLWDDFTVSTSTTVVRGAVTNNGAPLMCDGESLYIYSDATAAFAPSFMFAVGTASGATLYSANLTSSTTVATSTDTVTAGASAPFLLSNGTSITLSVGDYSAAIASSTYYGNWSGQFGVHCWTLGQ